MGKGSRTAAKGGCRVRNRPRERDIVERQRVDSLGHRPWPALVGLRGLLRDAVPVGPRSSWTSTRKRASDGPDRNRPLRPVGIKDLLDGPPEEPGDPEGQRKRRVVLAALERVDGLARHAETVGKLRLRPAAARPQLRQRVPHWNRRLAIAIPIATSSAGVSTMSGASSRGVHTPAARRFIQSAAAGT